MNKPDQITFRDWMKLYRVDMSQCNTCGGEGETRCTHCGYTHPCETCGGDGLLMLNGESPRSAYIAQITRELAIYEQFIGLPRLVEQSIESELK